MPNKTFNTRIRNKRDTAANWETVASTFQPLDGEMIIVYTADGATRFKVGRYDSAKGRLLYYNELPFTDESLGNKIYTQNEEPVDAADGALWVDLDEISSSPSIIPRPTSADNGKYLGCENGAATWMPVEASGGGDKWELINEFTIPEGAEESNSLSLTKDSNGNDFSLKKALLLANFPPYTGESTIPNISFANINGKTSGSDVGVPLGYTGVWPVLSKTSGIGSAYFVDVSGIFWREKSLKTDYVGLNRGKRLFCNLNNKNNTDKEWMAIPNVIEEIHEIGGSAMLIYSGCWFALYGVRA